MKINSISNNYTSNTVKQNNKYQTNPSFKASVPQPVINGLDSFYKSVANNGLFQKFAKSFSQSNNTFTHLLVAESCFLSGFYMLNTLRNKKIDKKQKPQMIINDAMTLGVSTAGAYLAEDKISDVVLKASEKYFVKHKDFYTQLGKKVQESVGNTPKSELLSKVGEVAQSAGNKGLDEVSEMLAGHLKGIVGEEGSLKAFQITGDKLKELQGTVQEAIKANSGSIDKAKETVSALVDDFYNSAAARVEADKILPGINKLKVLIIFGLIYRFLGPVVITPIANKISSKFFDKKDDKK